MTHKCIYQICEYAFATKQFQKYALCGLIFENTPFACNRSWCSLGESCSVWGRGLETIKKTRKHTIKQAKGTARHQKENTQRFNQTKNQSSKQSIKHTINQIKQSAKKENKRTRRRNLILKISNSRSTAPGGCYVKSTVY